MLFDTREKEMERLSDCTGLRGKDPDVDSIPSLVLYISTRRQFPPFFELPN